MWQSVFDIDFRLKDIVENTARPRRMKRALRRETGPLTRAAYPWFALIPPVVGRFMSVCFHMGILAIKPGGQYDVF